MFKRRSRLDIRKYVFANRIMDKWNVLPDSRMECTTLIDFKTKIKLQLEPETQIQCRPNVCYVSDSRLYMAKACVYLRHQCITLVASVNSVNTLTTCYY